MSEKNALPRPDVELLNRLIDAQLFGGPPYEHGKIGAAVANGLAALSEKGDKSAQRIAWTALCEWCAMRSHKRADALNVYTLKIRGKEHKASALAGLQKRAGNGRATRGSESKFWQQMTWAEHGLWLDSMRAQRDAIDVRVQAHQNLQTRWARECPHCTTAQEACAVLGLNPAFLEIV